MNGGTVIYDGDGNRVAKTVGGVTTRYLVDDLDPTGYAQVVEEVVGGLVQRTYTYGLSRISRRCAQRRTVDASGERDGFLQCGAACSAVSPAPIRSQACCRQRTLKCPEGANQFGKTVKVAPHGRQIPRRTQMRSCWSSWA
jgi:hypothetical protein